MCHDKNVRRGVLENLRKAWKLRSRRIEGDHEVVENLVKALPEAKAILC